MNHLLGHIDKYKRLLELYPNTEWIKRKLKAYEVYYEAIKRHSAITK